MEIALAQLVYSDYKALVEDDGFKPSVAEQIVFIRLVNGVYKDMLTN